METIQIESIMDEIRREIREDPSYREALAFEKIPELSGQESSAVLGEKYDEELLHRSVAEMGAHFQVPYYRQIGGGRLKVFFKRVLRKLVCFLVRPALEEITAFHALTAASVNTVANHIREQEAENQRKDRKIAELEKRLHALEEARKEQVQEK